MLQSQINKYYLFKAIITKPFDSVQVIVYILYIIG